MVLDTYAVSSRIGLEPNYNKTVYMSNQIDKTGVIMIQYYQLQSI